MAVMDDLSAAVQGYQAAVADFDRAIGRRLGVNGTDLRCIEVLMGSESVTPTELATRLHLTTGSVTTMLDRLAKLGFLTREADPGDRRKVIVRATDEIRRMAWETYGPLVADSEQELTTAYTEEELRLVTGFLERVRALQERHTARLIG